MLKMATPQDEAINKRFRFMGESDNLPWSSSARGTRDTLAEVFNDLGYKMGVEVGTRVGAYAKILCEKIQGLHLTCVDPWLPYDRLPKEMQHKRYAKAIETLSPFSVEILRMGSMEAVKAFPDSSIDFVFLDSSEHGFDEFAMDLILWAKKVRKGGIVAIHDYTNFRWGSVVKVVDAYTHCHHVDPWYVTSEKYPTAFWVKDYG